jgi:hypothetical protein
LSICYICWCNGLPLNEEILMKQILPNWILLLLTIMSSGRVSGYWQSCQSVEHWDISVEAKDSFLRCICTGLCRLTIGGPKPLAIYTKILLLNLKLLYFWNPRALYLGCCFWWDVNNVKTEKKHLVCSLIKAKAGAKMFIYGPPPVSRF